MSQLKTLSGNTLWYRHPEDTRYTLRDIAHALSLLCRFNGHVREFYSVAQHSVLVASLCAQRFPAHMDARWTLAALMHDAAEAYVGDLPTPLKETLPEFRALEKQVEDALFTAFDLPHPSTLPELHQDIKWADSLALSLEFQSFRAPSREWTPRAWGADYPGAADFVADNLLAGYRSTVFLDEDAEVHFWGTLRGLLGEPIVHALPRTAVLVADSRFNFRLRALSPAAAESLFLETHHLLTRSLPCLH